MRRIVSIGALSGALVAGLALAAGAQQKPAAPAAAAGAKPIVSVYKSPT